MAININFICLEKKDCRHEKKSRKKKEEKEEEEEKKKKREKKKKEKKNERTSKLIMSMNRIIILLHKLKNARNIIKQSCDNDEVDKNVNIVERHVIR
ncbi:hypothetical protein M8J77_003737 [Diaphorina citri]|nr:hypothetical protein M8J77_003737 [Diaphorina citri]